MLVAVRLAMSLVLVVRVEPAKTYAFVDEVVGTLFPLQLDTLPLELVSLHVSAFEEPVHVKVAASAGRDRASDIAATNSPTIVLSRRRAARRPPSG